MITFWILCSSEMWGSNVSSIPLLNHFLLPDLQPLATLCPLTRAHSFGALSAFCSATGPLDSTQWSRLIQLYLWKAHLDPVPPPTSTSTSKTDTSILPTVQRYQDCSFTVWMRLISLGMFLLTVSSLKYPAGFSSAVDFQFLPKLRFKVPDLQFPLPSKVLLQMFLMSLSTRPISDHLNSSPACLTTTFPPHPLNLLSLTLKHLPPSELLSSVCLPL